MRSPHLRVPLLWALVVVALLPAPLSAQSRLKDIASLQGAAELPLIGYGLVVGLNKTGDKRQTIFSTQTLANMLQRASRWAEAVDEYEAVVELQPTYFPALTRLAYLYFRQGMHARAVETWRRALPVCDDPALRKNIELFMRKLVADMQREQTG